MGYTSEIKSNEFDLYHVRFAPFLQYIFNACKYVHNSDFEKL